MFNSAIIPEEILLKITGELSPSEVINTASVNKAARMLYKKEAIWKKNLKIHFPKAYLALSDNNNYYYQTFYEAYHHDYKMLSKQSRALFSLAKEGNHKQLQARFEKMPSEIQLSALTTFLDKNKKSFLDWAKQSGKINHELLNYCYHEIILKNHAASTFQDKSLLHWAIECWQPVEILNELISQGVNINTDISEMLTPLMSAVREVNAETVEFLLKKGAFIDSIVCALGATALFRAVISNCEEMVRILLDHNANHSIALQKTRKIYAPAQSGDTPLIAAVKCGNKNIIKLLLNKAGRPILNEKNRITTHTPLMIAVTEKNAKMVKFLLKKNALIDERTQWGATALFIAAMCGHEEIVRILLDYNANTAITLRQTIKTYAPVQSGDTPLIAAVRLGHKNIVKALLDKQSHDINTPDFSGLTPLIIAKLNNNKDIIQLFLDKQKEIFSTSEKVLEQKLWVFLSCPELQKKIRKHSGLNALQNYAGNDFLQEFLKICCSKEKEQESSEWQSFFKHPQDKYYQYNRDSDIQRLYLLGRLYSSRSSAAASAELLLLLEEHLDKLTLPLSVLPEDTEYKQNNNNK